jgi:small subunit ribosomal protein S16
MVKIRLQRFGAHKAPKYRIVAADSRSPRAGKFLEILATYNPLTNPATVTVDAEKVNAWIAKGAQPTTTVKNILVANKVVAK